MATIILGAVGAGIGASVGGSVAGLSTAVIGRAVGATIGNMIDQRILGGSQSVEYGRVDRFRLTGASEGAPIAQVFGRARVGGQVIWSSRFLEEANTVNTGGKGGRRSTATTYGYSVSFAVAMCEGEILHVGRIWADGQEIAKKDLVMRVYLGAQDQMPDPKIEAVEGAGNAPSYRGISYVVFEDLDLARFGNRVPQFSFEVVRAARPEGVAPDAISEAVNGVALVPGTGEYALATTPVHFDNGLGAVSSANVHSASGKSDFSTAFDALQAELPNAKSQSLVVSWFGNDLRAGQCQIAPKVEQNTVDGSMPWVVSGSTRSDVGLIPQSDGRPVYGGTPADGAVIEAIEHMRGQGHHVMFYPFILMDQMADNVLVDPWTGDIGQPALPWRGRITTLLAPGVAGSPDGTLVADAEVDAFFGNCSIADFAVVQGSVSYSGPQEWSYRRFILHYAHLCAAAGGVDAFCIGSEMRGLTSIRGASGFPAVDKLIELAGDVRAVLGPDCKISYAADWSEYFGYQPTDGSGDVWYHLDPLWADSNIDFIGIDNYLPISDWRDGDNHLDAGVGSIYDLGYLKSGVLGGQYYDWYYASAEEEQAQIRTPIDDGAYGDDWVFRAKDIPNWWSQEHYNRPGGVKAAAPTDWVPGSKPIWFTEFGCAAIDKGTNEPNKFLDPKSSESSVPRFSTGARDDLIQAQYLRAMSEVWADPVANPVSDIYGGPMVDMTKAHVWAFDTRPYPQFPANTETWSDGGNYPQGHWISGRLGSQSLAGVVGAICEKAGVFEYDVSRLFGLVRGYQFQDNASPRSILQPLMVAYGFDAVERDGKIHFISRTGASQVPLDQETLVLAENEAASMEHFRLPEAEVAGRIRLNFTEAEGDFAIGSAEAIFPDRETHTVDQSELPLVLTRSEARLIVERWLAESRVAREGVRFSLPPSNGDIGAGDVVAFSGGAGQALYRMDRTEVGGKMSVEAVRIERNVYVPTQSTEDPVLVPPVLPALPLLTQFLDLPMLGSGQVAHAPFVAVTGDPWPGAAGVFISDTGDGFDLAKTIEARATIGVTLNGLDRASPWVLDRGPGLHVQFGQGAISSAEAIDVFNGANLVAIGDGTTGTWEVFQFSHAEMIAPQTWSISGRLRGQAGTEDVIPDIWPPGSRVVVLDQAVAQVEFDPAHRGLSKVFRVGPLTRAYDDPSYVEQTHAIDGVGLRPLSPVHLQLSQQTGGIGVSWVRRTRLDGDSWQAFEVPLGEAAEAYHIRVIKSGSVLREAISDAASWTYLDADQVADGANAPFEIEVAQISDVWGPGFYARTIWNG